MDCREVRERIEQGGDLGAAEGHMADCPPCRVLAEGDGALGRALQQPAGGDDADALAACFTALEADLAAEQKPLGKLRSLPTWARRGACIGTAVLICGFLWAAKFDAPVESWDRSLKMLNVLLLGALAVIALWNALRPLHQPPLTKGVLAGLTVVGLAIPLGLALMPYTAAGVATPAPKCFTFGSVVGIPVALLALGMSRAPWTVAAAAPLLLIALGAGMVGNIALTGTCPDHDPTHLVVGHASVVLAFSGVAAALGQALAVRGSEAPADADQPA